MNIETLTTSILKDSSKKSLNLLPERYLVMTDPIISKVEIILEQIEVAFLSPSKICENLNFRRETQIFANFAG